MSNSLETKTAFRPVKASESKIQATPAIDGYIYFTVDSKKVQQSFKM